MLEGIQIMLFRALCELNACVATQRTVNWLDKLGIALTVSRFIAEKACLLLYAFNSN